MPEWIPARVWSDGRHVTIPIEVRRRLGIHPGDTIVWTLAQGRVVISKEEQQG